jgi:hypothetical protein
MRYQIEISGMHCMGCSSLISMTMNESGLDNIIIDLKTGTAVFESSMKEDYLVKKLLNKVFTDIPGYSYKNMKTLEIKTQQAIDIRE